MEFQNAGIDIDRLPKAEALSLQPIDPRYLQVLFRQWVIRWLILLVLGLVAVYFSDSNRILWMSVTAGGLVLLAIINWWLIKRAFQYKAFAVREHDIIYRTGWLIQSIRTCPFNRIQHCSVDAGLFERQFELASLSVFTAGGNEADMKIPGLTVVQASTLRELIIQKTGTDVSSS